MINDKIHYIVIYNDGSFLVARSKKDIKKRIKKEHSPFKEKKDLHYTNIIKVSTYSNKVEDFYSFYYFDSSKKDKHYINFSHI